MPDADEDKYRNPRYGNALTRKELTPGRHIILCNSEYGNYHEFEVLSKPFYVKRQGDKQPPMKIKLRDLTSGKDCERFLSDMGVIRYGAGFWNPSYYTLAAATRDTIPAPTGYVPTMTGFEDEEWEEEEEES